MSGSSIEFQEGRAASPGDASSRRSWLLIGVVTAALAGAAVMVHPLAGAAVLIGAMSLCIVLAKPDLVTAGVLFLLYSNAIVVAVRFHGLPGIVAQLVPGFLLAPLVYHVFVKARGVAAGPTTPFVLAYGLIQLLCTITSSDPVMALPNLIEFLTEGLILYLLVLNLIRTEATLRLAVTSLLLAGCLMGAVPLVQQITGRFDNNFAGFGQKDGDGDEKAIARMAAMEERGEEIAHRLAGSIGEKNRFAQIMLMLVPLGLLAAGCSATRQWRLLGVVAAFLSAAGALLTFSRATFVAVAMVLVLVGLLRLVERRKIVLVGILAVAAMFVIPSNRERLLTLVNLQDLATSGKHSDADGALKGRATEMAAAGLVFLDHPLTGVGPGMFMHHAAEYGERIGLKSLSGPRAAHCLPLDIAAETGILGIACVLMIFLTCCRQLLRARHCELASPWMRAASTAFLVAMLFYLTTSLFLHFAYIRYIWIMVALAEATALITHRQHQSRQQQSLAALHYATSDSRRSDRGLREIPAGS